MEGLLRKEQAVTIGNSSLWAKISPYQLGLALHQLLACAA